MSDYVPAGTLMPERMGNLKKEHYALKQKSKENKQECQWRFCHLREACEGEERNTEQPAKPEMSASGLFTLLPRVWHAVGVSEKPFLITLACTYLDHYLVVEGDCYTLQMGMDYSVTEASL